MPFCVRFMTILKNGTIFSGDTYIYDSINFVNVCEAQTGIIINTLKE